MPPTRQPDHHAQETAREPQHSWQRPELVMPRDEAGQASEVQLEITPSNQIVRIVLVDRDGATTEFRFAGWKENLAMSDNQFRFTPPPGVETVEGELEP